MEAVNKYRVIRDKRLGRLTIAIAQLAIGYGLVLVAINDGNLIVYLVTFILLVCGIKNLIILAGSFIHGKH
jgi:cytochrome c-type biogenesis protein CcmE